MQFYMSKDEKESVTMECSIVKYYHLPDEAQRLKEKENAKKSRMHVNSYVRRNILTFVILQMFLERAKILWFFFFVGISSFCFDFRQYLLNVIAF